MNSNAIREFKGEYAFLSNFARLDNFINLDGMFFWTVEHAYQAAKTSDLNFRRLIAQAKTPREAKRIGRKVPMRPAWDQMKDVIMFKLLQVKFQQTNFKQKLIETYPAELVEGNWWGDHYWGVNVRTGVGENRLGKLLMQIREELLK